MPGEALDGADGIGDARLYAHTSKPNFAQRGWRRTVRLRQQATGGDERPHTPNGCLRSPREGFRRSTGTGRVSLPTTAHDGPKPTTREPFAELFADPRHYRGDCRLLRTAIRRGWLDDAPQDVRDALVSRFDTATREREAAGFASDAERTRVLLAEVSVGLELGRSNLADAAAGLRWLLTGDTTPRPGRPRERVRTTDHPTRLDANALRRRAIAEGIGPATVTGIDASGERIGLAIVPDARYGVRWWLLCPRCGGRRVHLYGVAAGWRCRGCAGVRGVQWAWVSVCAMR